MLLLRFIRIPTPDRGRARGIRPAAGEIAAQPKFIVAVFSGALGYGVMNFADRPVLDFRFGLANSTAILEQRFADRPGIEKCPFHDTGFPDERLQFLHVPSAVAPATFAASVLAGLSAPSRSLSCQWFYDRRGSELFERICELPEYYLTRPRAGRC